MSEIDRKTEQVVVFVDNSAFYRALHLLDVPCKVDYRLLRDTLISNRTASQLRFYCGEIAGDAEARKGFYQVLRNAGFDIFAGHRYGTRGVFNAALDEPLQRWIHCQIAYDMASLMNWGNYDTFILVSGDPEYAGVIHDLRRRGVNVEVAFFDRACSRDLRETASCFREIDICDCLLGSFDFTGQEREECRRRVANINKMLSSIE